MRTLEVRRHSISARPAADDPYGLRSARLTQAGVTLARGLGDGMGRFDRVSASTLPRAPETAVAMGFAVDELYDPEDELVLLPQVWRAVGMGRRTDWAHAFAIFAAAARTDAATVALGERHAARWREAVAVLSEGGRGLLITHGSLLEAAAVALLPDADHAGWGPPCGTCEGLRLVFEGDRCIGAEIVRVDGAVL